MSLIIHNIASIVVEKKRLIDSPFDDWFPWLTIIPPNSNPGRFDRSGRINTALDFAGIHVAGVFRVWWDSMVFLSDESTNLEKKT